MEPTLDINQRVLVNRFIYHLTDPEIGDIVVFHPPVTQDMDGSIPPDVVHAGDCAVRPSDTQPCPKAVDVQADDTFIKRIAAGPGDTLRIEDGHPVVNGVRAEESFVRECNFGGACNLPQEITIPPDHYFMMGDNRGESRDSRFFGPVPRDWIIGKAFATYWPPRRVGIF